MRLAFVCVAVLAFAMTALNFSSGDRFVGSQAAFEERIKRQIKMSAGSQEDPHARAVYEWMRLRDPLSNEIPEGIRQKELAFAAKLPTKEQIARAALAKGERVQVGTWVPRGPANIGGRTRALAYDVSDTSGNTILAGGVSGGMWRTTNGGTTWTKTTALDQLQSVTCLVQDTRPGKQNIWYYGTGELVGNSAGARNGSGPLRGDGIYKSTDGGLTWNVLPSTTTGTPHQYDQMFDYVWDLVIDTSNQSQDEIYAATIGGVLRSTDAGTSWTTVLGGVATSNSRFSDLAITSNGTLYAALSERDMNLGSGAVSQGIYRSTDGVVWTNITPGGVGFPTAYGRIVVGIAPSNENIVYFLIQGTNGTNGTNQINGHQFWKYTANTNSWANLGASLPNEGTLQGNGQFDSQGGYDMLVHVKPNDPNFVLIGGTNLYRSTDGGINWQRIGGYAGPTSYALYSNHHPDLHSGMWRPGSNLIYLSGHDGGVSKTLDITSPTVSWTYLNNSYLTTQFYAVAIDQVTPGDPKIIGGMQDNSSYLTLSTSASVAWTNLLSGDGSYCAISDGSIKYYVSAQFGQLYRGRFDDLSGPVLEARVDPASGLNNNTYLFVTPFVLDPNNSKVMYFAAAHKLYRNSDIETVQNSSGQTSVNWSELTEATLAVGISGRITAIGVSKSPPDRVYYSAVYTGSPTRIFRLDNVTTGANPIPTDVTGSNLPTAAGSNVSCIEVNPTDHNKAIVAFSNYNIQSLFYTTDGGSSWTPIGGNLEQNPDGTGNGPSVRWVEMIKVGITTYYFVGTSVGLYSTTSLNGPSTVWVKEGASSIGSVVVEMVKAREADGLVVVGTHGNGVYSSGDVVSVDDGSPALAPSSYSLQQNFPNPFNPSTMIRYTVASKGHVRLRIYDVRGRLITTLVNEEKNSGTYEIPWNAVEDGAPLPSGVYFCRLDATGFTETRKMLLLR